MPSIVSTNVIPAVNNIGNIKIDQLDVSFEAPAESPKRLISLAVSNPSANRKPIGNNCQLLDTNLNNGGNRRASQPRFCNKASMSSSRTSSSFLTLRKAL